MQRDYIMKFLLRHPIVCGIVVPVLAALFWWWFRPTAKTVVPTSAQVTRQDLRRVVASTARIVANLDVDIKCKASGTVVELPRDISDRVKTGDLLIKLDPVDEQRAVTQAENTVKASQARLVQAKENLSLAEATLRTDTLSAKAALVSASARAKDLRAQALRQQELRQKKLVSQEEADAIEANAVQSEAARDQANATVEALNARTHTLELRRQDVQLSEVQLTTDQLNLENARQRLRETEIFAPMDGVVTARSVQVGNIVSSGITNIGGGTAVMTVADLSRLFALASVDESDVGTVELGQEVSITVDAFANRRFTGKVVRIATKGLSTSNVVTFEVKIEILGFDTSGKKSKGPDRPEKERKNKGKHSDSASAPVRLVRDRPQSATNALDVLRPEMTANIEIVTAERLGVLSVPAEALRRGRGRWTVQVVDEKGATSDRDVEVGISDGAATEILSGLNEGDKVILQQRNTSSKWQGRGGMGPPHL
jgi:multidrug resistance efflux pump